MPDRSTIRYTYENDRPADAEASVVRDLLVWSVAGHRIQISLADVFRG